MTRRAGDVGKGRLLGLGVGVGLAMWLIMGIAQAQEMCDKQKRCDVCIQTPGCMWCAKPKGNTTEDVLPNCQPMTLNLTSFCDPQHVENPENSVSVTTDIPLTIVTEDKKSRPQGEKIIQLSPQGIKLKLRKGTPKTIVVTYRQAQDYPVDLYYLMDLSNSMKDDKDKLATLGGKLTDTLRNLTSQFTIGFGSFVDKVMMPYTDTSPDKINGSCEGCAKPYAFKNILSLSTDSNLFTQRVNEAPISANVDLPEGGFEALMQAMVCKDAIGWRNQSRRIIVYSTDNKFHYAGDGRLAGVITPNDMKCHLNSAGEYDDYDKYDYPSIAQINKVSKDQNINIIFAVSKFKDLYQKLSSLIETSSYGLMNNDSSNVVELVVDQYKQISSVVRLTDNSTNSPVSIRYSSSCRNSTPPIPTNKCSGISQGVEVTFNVEVEATECPKEQDKVIIEVKTLQDSLFLEIEFDCNCNCETEGRTENSSVCSNKGALVCGVCECFPDFQGKHCMCSIQDASDGRPEDEALCKKSPSDQRVCSGQGHCSCGECACREGITGQFCQCNSRKCLLGTGDHCSGHGVCECDVCKCDEEFTGKFCECPTDEVCIEEGTSDVCSGHGKCVCGKCKCKQSYSGKYCDDCPTCSTGKCLEFRDCVQCLFNNPPCACNLTTTTVDSLKPYKDKGAQECTFEIEAEGCYFSFSYLFRHDDMGYDIYVKKKKQCPERAPLMGIVFGLVAGIVAIGLLTLLIWKLVTTLHDRKEYARFEDERKTAMWNTEDNPLYQEPSCTIQNPVYAKNA